MAFLEIKGNVKESRRVGGLKPLRILSVSVPKTVKKADWGIYFSLIRIGDHNYPAITHLGPPKGFSLTKVVLECTLLTFRKKITTRSVKIKFIEKFREVKRSVNPLAGYWQRIKDRRLAKKYFGL